MIFFRSCRYPKLSEIAIFLPLMLSKTREGAPQTMCPKLSNASYIRVMDAEPNEIFNLKTTYLKSLLDHCIWVVRQMYFYHQDVLMLVNIHRQQLWQAPFLSPLSTRLLYKVEVTNTVIIEFESNFIKNWAYLKSEGRNT